MWSVDFSCVQCVVLIDILPGWWIEWDFVVNLGN